MVMIKLIEQFCLVTMHSKKIIKTNVLSQKVYQDAIFTIQAVA